MSRIAPGSTLILLLASALAACSPGDRAGAQSQGAAALPADEADHDEHADAHAHEESEPDLARIDPQSASAHGIEVERAGPRTVAESVALTGRLIIEPRQVALVRARFAGPVRSVAKEVGDPVRKGEVLAQVESNESLTVYEVRAPFAGVVLERMTSVGDVAGSEPLFRVGDVTRLQAELRVFPKQQGQIDLGDEAVVRVGEREVPGKVVGIVPEIDSRTQAMLARVELTAREPLEAAPGQFVMGRVQVGHSEAPVAVAAESVQRLEGREVVFVPDEEGFRARGVTTGRSDGEYVEITAGLQPGEPYVARGAFLVKAEIGKNMAGHEH